MRRRLRLPKEQEIAGVSRREDKRIPHGVPPAVGDSVETDDAERERRRRECPVPKPGAIVGQILGFRNEHDSKRPSIRIENARSDPSAIRREVG